MFLPKFFPDSVYTPPPIALVLSLAAVAALVGLANSFVESGSHRDVRVASPWLVVVLSGLCAFLWYSQVLLAFGIFPALPPWLAFCAGVAPGVAVLVVVNRWISSHNWSTRHTTVALLGLVLAMACGGVIALTVGNASTLDRIGHLVVNAVAIVWLARRLRSESRPGTRGS
jgi:hypothetical protein